MALVVMDALSHQAIRDAGSERQAYGARVSRAAEWAGIRLEGFRAQLALEGHELKHALPTDETLAGAAVLVIASRSQLLPFASAALGAIDRFVTAGGALLLMGNHRGMVLPQQQVAAAMRLPMAFANASIGGDPEIELLPHPMTAGVRGLSVRNACWLVPEAGAEVFARFRTSGKSFGLATMHGKGRVAALADSGFISTLDDAGRDMFAAADNARFFGNALNWLLDRER